MDCSPPGSSVRRTLQARTLDWIAVSSSRGSSRPRDDSVSLMFPVWAVGVFTTSTTWEICNEILYILGCCCRCCCCQVASVVSDSVQPHRWQPTRLPRPWDSPGKNTGVGCYFLLQRMKVKSESEVAQSSPTLNDPHGLQPTTLLCPWDFPGKSTGVGCHCLLWYIWLRIWNNLNE